MLVDPGGDPEVITQKLKANNVTIKYPREEKRRGERGGEKRGERREERGRERREERGERGR